MEIKIRINRAVEEKEVIISSEINNEEITLDIPEEFLNNSEQINQFVEDYLKEADLFEYNCRDIDEILESSIVELDFEILETETHYLHEFTYVDQTLPFKEKDLPIPRKQWFKKEIL